LPGVFSNKKTIRDQASKTVKELTLLTKDTGNNPADHLRLVMSALRKKKKFGEKLALMTTFLQLVKKALSMMNRNTKSPKLLNLKL